MTDAPPQTRPEGAPNPLIKLAIEFGPLLVFFFSNSRFGLLKATAAFMVAILLSLAASWRLEKRLPPMALVTAGFVLVFGGLTLILADELFIKLKPTIVNLFIALVLALGMLRGKLFLRMVFDEAIQITETGWRVLTLRWIGFSVALAIANEVVWRNFSTDTWVGFKVWGIFPATLVFTVVMVAPILTRHGLAEEAQAEPE